MYAQTTLLGNVGKTPVFDTMPSGDGVCTLSVATTKYWTDKNTNEKKEKTTWHQVKFYGKQADNVNNIIKSGNKIFVIGEPTNESYEKDGVTKYTSYIKGREFVALSPKDANQDINPNSNQNFDEIPESFNE